MISHLQRIYLQQATYHQSQGSSAFGVNEEQGRDCSHDLNSTISERCIQGLGRCVANIFENSRAVERDNCNVSELDLCTRKRRLTVDTAHLLSKHDSRSTVVGTPDPRHGEAIPHTGEVARATSLLEFLLVDNP